jgi:hypothetical protein
MIRTMAISAALLLVSACAFAQGDPHPAAATAAEASLPHDRHEGLNVSADCYSELSRAKEKFGKANPFPVGILPVEVFLRNETSQPIRINLSTIQLTVHPTGSEQQEVNALPVQEVAAVVAHPNGPSAPHASRFPIGIPSASDSKTDKMLEVLRPLSLDADIVPPLGMIHGFVFFDLSRDMSLAKGASLYVPDVTVAVSQKTLMFFEVNLDRSSEQ